MVEIDERHRKESDVKGKRAAKIAIRTASGSLDIIKSNPKAVLCAECGGVFGDPFDGISVATNVFAIHHYGGSGWRWANTYQFGFSRRDNTWQLVLVRELSYHTSDPDKQTVKTYRPPRHFGKIDFSDFDPDEFLGVGKR